jgi:hypothetical protein
MSTHALNFVHLRYSPRSSDTDAPTGIPLLVIQNGPALEIVIRPDWHEGLGSEDREYLTELIGDWRRTTAAEIPALLQALGELSMGPLRTLESGATNSERFRALKQATLFA